MSKNFENFGNKNYAQNTLKIGVIGTLIMFGLLPFIPESIIDKIPNFLIPIFYIAIIYIFMNKYQDKMIKDHIKNGGLRQSGWKAIAIAVLSLLISLTYFFTLTTFFT